ncbi:MAG: isopeptide-forming domain-containing fimbrial protein [Bifidobacterium animalis]|nr:isopeptide-forming domain-containing fimbrial protein [Bifidobacterium animalis]
MNLKRVFAGVAAAATALGTLAIGAATANAADSGTTATIKITGDVQGRTFTAYPLGTYTNEVITDGNLTSVDFNQNSDWDTTIATAAQRAAAVNPAMTIPDAYKNNELAWIATLSQTNDAARLRVFAEALANASKKPTPAATATAASDATATSVSLPGLTPGYYLVLDSYSTGASAGAPIMVGTATTVNSVTYSTLNGVQLGEAVAKPTTPTIPGKTITGGTTDNTVSIGDQISYKITGIVPGNPSGGEVKMGFKDVAGKGLTLPKPNDANGFTVTIGGQQYTSVTITQSIDNAKKETTTEFNLGDVRNYAGQRVEITYTATVNSDAVDAVTNSARIQDPDGNWATDFHEIQSKIFSFDFTKQDADGKPLAGAEFTISGDNIDSDFTTNGGTAVVTSGADGKVTFNGLAAGTYTVKETKVPNSFLQNVQPEFTVKIDANGNIQFGSDTIWNLVTPNDNNTNTATAVVKNVKSITQLPLTGAAGITMLVVVALLIGGAAALIAVRSHSLKQQLRG